MADARLAPELAAERLKERIYATITMVAVLIGLTFAGGLDALGAALTVAVTALGLWLASLVADVQAHRTVHRASLDRSGMREALFVSSPLLLAAVSPLVLVALSALGAMGLVTALRVAAGLDVLSLFLWGYAGGRRMGNGPWVAVIAGIADTAIGLAVAVVKLLAGH
ncbi:hypothetical protein [Actinomadura parmotrematis]|uniref:Uncharacterized protein n=1 Tax=Actinomadura parmotrematis TaxID=2864039 RepID=A0ABS7G178_9ACTN|nr:hypothetical protein [Actinomadura parmotrematis]MBW8486470.1 hypothetical protein [Actinomadura parmotrematis]